MNAEMKANIDALRETVSALRKAMRLIGGSEDAVLSILGDAWGKKYKSSDNDNKSREAALITALEMCVAWNNVVDELGDSAFHKDTLTKRFLESIWDEQSHEDRTRPSDRVL